MTIPEVRRPFAAAPPPPRAAQSNLAATTLAVVDRLKQAVREEIDAIRKRARVDYESFSARKATGLLELNRLAPALAKHMGNATLREALADLNRLLEEDRRTLAIQLKASKTIADVIAQEVRKGQSDGTYSRRSWLGYDDR